MSASREKKARQEFNASGAVDPKAAREAQERAKQRRSNWLYGGIAIVFVLVAAALLVWNSNVIQRGSAAVTVEGLIPCGEGAGYAGGIMSAAVDGVRAACRIIEQYAPME